MILDAIFGLFAGLAALLAEGVLKVVFAGANLGLMVIEMVGGLFVEGFQLGRLSRKQAAERSSRLSAREMIGTAVILVVIGGWLVVPKIVNRKIALVAEDGHSLPFAMLIVHTDEGNEHRRTDSAGNVIIPRFSTSAVTIKDPRYVEKTWAGDEIEPELVVDRTVLGAGLDVLAERLLKPAKE